MREFKWCCWQVRPSRVVDYVVNDGSRWDGWRIGRWLSGRKNSGMHGGNNGISEGINVVVRNGRADSMDVVGSTFVAGSKQDREGAGGRLRHRIPWDLWNMVRPNASRGIVP